MSVRKGRRAHRGVSFIAEKLESRRLFAVPLGAEFQVNASGRTGSTPAMVTDSDGNILVVWSSSPTNVTAPTNTAASAAQIFATMYDSTGAVRIAPFQVNVFTSAWHSDPSVAVDGSGNFVVSWTSNGQDGDGDGIFARRFDVDGNARGGEFNVNTSFPGSQDKSSVASDSFGNFVVAWETDGLIANARGVRAQRFRFDGRQQGVEFTVNAVSSGDQHGPSVAMDPAGDFVIAWTWDNGNGLPGVYARRYRPTGAQRGAQFQVSADVIGSEPRVTMDSAGDFVVAYQSQDLRHNIDVFVRSFDINGIAKIAPFRATADAAQKTTIGSLAMAADGSLAVTWRGQSKDGKTIATYGRQFDASGVATSGDFQITANDAGVTGADRVIALGLNGDFVVVWKRLITNSTNTNLFARRFDPASATSTFVGGTLTITGTDLADNITLAISNKTKLVATVNGTPTTYTASTVTRIVVSTGDGDDTVVLTGAVIGSQINGGNGNDSLVGGDGNDTIFGSAGNDTIDGGKGNDRIDAGKHNDSVLGGAGNDSIFGNFGNDTLSGDAGDDQIDGGQDNDSISGGAGNDIITGGTALDILNGDAGNDLFHTVDTFKDHINGGLGTDSVDGNGYDILVSVEN